MDTLKPFEQNALAAVRKKAKATEAQDTLAIHACLRQAGVDGVEARRLVQKLLGCCEVTLNFHPDRYDGGGRLVIDGLMADGAYSSQFATGTTNGGKTAFSGGQRDLWERTLFSGAYHGGTAAGHGRPKYGALNILGYRDGASARFGSCFLTLRPHVLARCTFAYGDSVTNPEALGTADAWMAVLRALLEDVARSGRFLNRPNQTVKDAVGHILSLGQEHPQVLGRNMDDCIEAHVHGPLCLQEDVACLYLDESFLHGEIHSKALCLSARYGIAVHSIPERRVRVSDMDSAFRGEAIPLLARKIVAWFGVQSGEINAEIIGRASRDSIDHPQAWLDVGIEAALFQYFKQLWHTVAAFG